MSIGLLDVIDRLPAELGARLESDPFFANIAVVVADKGNVAEEINRKQASIAMKSGKRGVGVIVLQVVGDDPNPNMSFGPLTLRPAFQVFENVELNQHTTNGTGKTARRVARRIVSLVKNLRLIGVANSITPDKPCIEPVQFDNEKLVGYQVNFFCSEADTENILKCAPVIITPNGGSSATVTLACATVGATIYYTTDDTLPSAANGTAYTTAINVPSGGFTLRACAYKTDLIPSDVERAAFTHP